MVEVPGFDPRYEPPAIKAALPVEWVLGHLFGVWGAGTGAMLPCPLPHHQDDTPSFNLWAPDDEGIPMRWGCFGCGSQGDVIDLIREARDVGFTDACTLAVDELLPAFKADDWQPSDAQADYRRAAEPEELEAALEHMTLEPAYVQAFLDRKELALPVSWLKMEWGWTGAYEGMPVVVFPHRDYAGDLRGLRLRSVRRGNRWTVKGSRFEALYGAWRMDGHRAVLLCEGETDTVYAAWQLRAQPYDVVGLATGAAQKPPERAVQALEGGAVWLAFDGDMAGRIATNRWREALAGKCELRVVDMPDGHDICSVGATVKDLIGGGRRV